MRRADRLYRLLAWLRRRRQATAAELAEHLGVSERTIYRDIRELIDSGVDVRGEAGVGYRLEARGELPPIALDVEEVHALVFGARLVERWSDPSLRAAARSAVDKLSAVLPAPQRRWLDETPLFTPSFPPPASELDWLPTLRAAVNERAALRLTYADVRGERSERVVFPIGLWFWTETWTLGAWCTLREDYRSFRVDRLVNVARTGAMVPDEPRFSVAALVEAVRKT